MTITQTEYQQEIQELAEAIQQEAKEYGNDLHDVAWETIDSHEWVIYTAKARQVGCFVSNPDAWKEYGGDFSDEVRAFAGMQEDVMDIIHRNDRDK